MQNAVRRWAALAAITSVTAIGAMGCAQAVPTGPLAVQQAETGQALSSANQRVALANALARQGKIDEAVALLKQAGAALGEAGDLQMLGTGTDLGGVASLIDQTVSNIESADVNRQETAIIGISQVLDALNTVGIKRNT